MIDCPICQNEIKTISDSAMCRHQNRIICSPCGQGQAMSEFFKNNKQYNTNQ